MKGLRLLYVDTGRSFGGAERVTLALASAFAAEGASVGCVVDPAAAPFTEALRRIGTEPLPLLEADRMGRVSALARAVRAFRADVVHVHRTWPLSDRYASFAARRGGARRVLATEHVRWERCGLRDRAAKRLLVRFDDPIVAVSEAVRGSLIRYWGADERRVVVVANGVDTARFRPRAKIPAPSNGRGPVIGSIGRLERQKGFDLLLDAFARVIREREGAELHLVGEGSERAALEERARSLGIGEAVRFDGAVPDVAPVLARLDLFVLASRWEGLPLTILEAMAAGVPVVATAVDGSSEAIRDGIDGLLVPPGSAERLASAILAALADRPAAEGRARSARARVEEGFSLASMIAGYRRVCRP